MDAIEAWGLELAPSQVRGTFESPRVLRAPDTSDSAVAVAKLVADGEGGARGVQKFVAVLHEGLAARWQPC